MSQVPSSFSGGCACGAIRYECLHAPVAMFKCHCRDCQHASGTGHFPSVFVSKKDFHVNKGQPRIHVVTAASGASAHRAFCAECGSPLFGWSTSRPDFIGVRVGSLDDSSWFSPTWDFWTVSAQPWDVMNEETQKIGTEPPPKE